MSGRITLAGLANHAEYYREGGRYYKRNRRTGESHEISFAELMRSHQIARELIDDERGDYGAAASEALSEAKQIQRGWTA